MAFPLPAAATIAGALAVLASGATLVEVERTRALAAEVDARGAELAQGQVLRQVDELVVRMLAETSAASSDDAIRAMLTKNGINFTVNRPAAPPQAASAPPAAR